MRRKSFPRSNARKRRGALLLVVLSVLIVFLMLGTVLVTHATRSRTAATTFASAGIAANKEAFLARQALDEALMQLIRGGSNGITESILEDKYADASISSTAETIAVNGPLIEVTMPSAAVPHYLDLNGRILTFVPDSSDASSMSSYRILRAQPDLNAADSLILYLANIRPHPSAVPPTSACDILINAPEFREEPYDSFDDDEWLTQYTLGGSDPTAPPDVQIVRPSLAVSGTATVDNDGDGIADGEWRSDILSSIPLPDGSELTFDVSYLVYDLDSRLNVNAHGSADRLGYTNASWGTAPTDVEPGFGWGVADVYLSKLFATDPNAFGRLLGGYSSSLDNDRSFSLPQPASKRARPLLQASDGRYGLALEPAPGATQSGTAARDYEKAVYGDDKSIDLSAMMKVFVTSGTVPTLEYRVPADYSVDLEDDPYEARLDDDAPRLSAYSRSGSSTASDANLFTLGELERILRQFDPDATNLPQRLAGLLGAEAEPTRMLITTDSWDTPVLTGTTAAVINSYAKNELQKPYDVLSPDISAGMKFDVNRPFDDSTPANLAKSKSEFCKHFYSLLVAITDSASSPPDKKNLAQWAVNVLDYRDSDSNITAFTFDTDIADGWGPGTDGWNPEENTVFGNERPDLIIAQTLAWWSNDSPHGELFVTLYRPPVPLITDEGNPPKSVPIAPLDPALADDSDPPKLDLAKTVPGTTEGVIHPIWRIRYQAQDEDPFYIRFDPLGQDQTLSEPFNSGNTSYPTSGDQTTHLLPADGFICIRPQASSPENVTVDSAIAYTVAGGKELRFNSSNSANGAKVHLERLANPSIPFNDDRTSSDYNPYVSVNSFPAKSVSRNGAGNSDNWKSYVRSDPFWKTPTQFETNIGNPPILTKLALQNRGDFPWPNRSFISHVELALVPPGDAGAVMDSVLNPGSKPYHYLSSPDVLGAEDLIKRFLDATHVPSRFVGSALTIDQSQDPDKPSLAPIGMADIPYRQLSRYREPGKINVNTMPTTAYASNAPWRALLGDTAATLSGTSRFSANPATFLVDVLDLNEAGEMFVDTSTDSDTDSNGNSNGNNNAGTTAPSLIDLFPLLGYRTAIRLGNVATIRSNVFAVWVTVKITDSTKTEPTFHRLFAIVDRTLPTAFQKGKDLNAKDVIRLKRYLY
jgi:hypothetical protein